MRAALYARVSSEEQVEGYSIDAQKRAFQSIVKDKKWTIYREYIDEGKSARTDNINKRPAFKEMITDALAGQFDVVVVHKLDRFARNLRITLEYFDKLSKAGVSFVSVNENMDFSTPWGRLALTLLGGLAQLYSDNLSLETKKGWHERRSQGLYCGALPFGAMKGDNGVPVPDTQDREVTGQDHHGTVKNYEGLTMAFNLAHQGQSDRMVAVWLNNSGYKTTGTHGPRPFSKDTVKDMMKNRFYIGEIPDGSGGWLKAKHEAFIDSKLFDEVSKMRERRAHRPKTIRADSHTYSLSCIAKCAECGSGLRSFKGRGRVRLACNGRIKGNGCLAPSSFLDIYESQLTEYLRVFSVPEDYREKILAAQKTLESVYDTQKQRPVLTTRLERLKELYEWGHKSKEEYLKEYREIKTQLDQLQPLQSKNDALDKLASFLNDISRAWEQATQEQRNRLVSVLFEAVWIGSKKVIGVTPRQEFKPFFDLKYEGMSNGVMHWRPRRDSNP